jgi:hypothetical protein
VQDFPQAVCFDRPLVHGIHCGADDLIWDFLLFAVKVEYWAALSAAIRGASGIDWQRKIVWSAVEIPLSLVDFIWHAQNPVSNNLQRFIAIYYSVNSNRRRYGFHCENNVFCADTKIANYHVISAPPEKEDILFAEQLFGGVETPFRALEVQTFPRDLPKLSLPSELRGDDDNE